MTRSFVLALFAMLSCGGAAAQRVAEPPATEGRAASVGAPAVVSEAGAAAASAQQQQRLRIERVEGFAEQFLAFRDTGTKVMGIARLADILWPGDAGAARRLFDRAIELTASPSGAPSGEAELLKELRREVVSLIGRRDPAWAARLNEQDESTDAAESTRRDFGLAYDLLATSPRKAAELAGQSLRGGVYPYMSALLLNLRRRDEEAADALFLKTLERLAEQTTVDGGELAQLATYIFTSPKLDPADPSLPADATLMLGVGRLLLPDITANRPGIRPALVRAYLRAAAHILARRSDDPEQQQFYYATAYLLLPKARQYTPELVAPLSAAMQGRSQEVPAELASGSALASFSAPFKDTDEMLREIARKTGRDERDGGYLSVVFSLWQRKEFERARSVAARISDDGARHELATMIDFGEGARALDGDPPDLSGAERLARKLPAGVERSLLWLGIADALFGAGQPQRGEAAVNEALASARQLAEARRPFLTLNAASQLSRVVPSLAQATLTGSVNEFNARRAEASGGALWQQRIEAGRVWRDFPLRVRGVSYGWGRALPPLLSSDLEGTVAAIGRLEAEPTRAQALLVAAAFILKQPRIAGLP